MCVYVSDSVIIHAHLLPLQQLVHLLQSICSPGLNKVNTRPGCHIGVQFCRVDGNNRVSTAVCQVAGPAARTCTHINGPSLRLLLLLLLPQGLLLLLPGRVGYAAAAAAATAVVLRALLHSRVCRRCCINMQLLLELLLVGRLSNRLDVLQPMVVGVLAVRRMLLTKPEHIHCLCNLVDRL